MDTYSKTLEEYNGLFPEAPAPDPISSPGGDALKEAVRIIRKAINLKAPLSYEFDENFDDRVVWFVTVKGRRKVLQ